MKPMRALVAMIGALVLVALPAPASSETVTVLDLVTAGEAWAGEVVSVEGELVGDYGRRPDGCVWTQLNGDPYVTRPLVDGGGPVGGNVGIGIRMDQSLAAGLDPPGRHGIRGPVVTVTGTWRWHDARRQGESFLDVVSLEVIEGGRRLPMRTDWTSALGGVALLGLAILVLRLGRSAVYPRSGAFAGRSDAANR